MASVLEKESTPDTHRNDAKLPALQPGPTHKCRFCGEPVSRSFVDLGLSPLCQNLISRDQLTEPETFYPLHAVVCERCWLVQIPAFVSPGEIFNEYAYFSSYSTSWLEHARQYCEKMIERFSLTRSGQVVEIASNDGYLLRHFVAAGFPTLGIEPAANVAQAAMAAGIPTRVKFFGSETARELVAEGIRPQLLVGNNVLAHVPDLNDFVAGLKLLLAPNGVLTMEFPHLAELIRGNQFDTIYHEHFCYFSFVAVTRIFAAHGLNIFDVEQLPTHGGSLRIYARHAELSSPPVSSSVSTLRARELADGFERPEVYEEFAERVRATKRNLLTFLIEAKQKGRSVAGYGAPGKGNTLLNYCGIRTDMIEYTVDRNPYRQGKYCPGSRIPIESPDRLAITRPDFILLLPWNLREELTQQLEYTRAWGARLVVPIPQLEVCS